MTNHGPDDLPVPGSGTGRILVVDDDERNRMLLRDLLELEDHSVVEAENGPEAIERIGAGSIDLVLLDVNMPGLDGFEVTRRLRADPATASLPILLVTALADREQRLKGIAAGANDYVVKPIDGTDLRLRVRNALHLRQLHNALSARYQDLERLEQLRDSLVHMIVHDLRSPLTGLIAYLQLIEMDLGTEDSDRAVLLESIADARAVAGNLSDMVTNVLDVNRFEAGAMPLVPETVELGAVIRAAVSGLGGRAIGARVDVELGQEPVTLVCDPVLIRRVVVNLLANGLKFSPKDRNVRIELTPVADAIRLTISDRGKGIPPELRTLIFEKFGQVKTRENRTVPSTGLGLTFCKLAVEAHGGAIGVDSVVGEGSSFWFVLPRDGAVLQSAVDAGRRPELVGPPHRGS